QRTELRPLRQPPRQFRSPHRPKSSPSRVWHRHHHRRRRRGRRPPPLRYLPRPRHQKIHRTLRPPPAGVTLPFFTCAINKVCHSERSLRSEESAFLSAIAVYAARPRLHPTPTHDKVWLAPIGDNECPHSCSVEKTLTSLFPIVKAP